MTKAEIKANNEKVLGVLADFDDLWNSLPTHGRPFKFRNCSAHTQSGRIDDKSDMTVLISYDTPVAAVYRDRAQRKCVCIDYLRYIYGYTSTSAQHINKFFHDFVDGYARCYNCEIIKYRYETERG